MGDSPINIAYPAAEDLRLRIAMGACRFEARAGEGEAWVAGVCYDPTDRRPPRILEEAPSVTITEAEPSFERIPAVFGGVPRYEVEVGDGFAKREGALVTEGAVSVEAPVLAIRAGVRLGALHLRAT